MFVPSRGRPESVPRMVEAWLGTDAYRVASLVYVIDQDDPRYAEYQAQRLDFPRDIGTHPWVQFVAFPHWEPMVPKLNRAAKATVEHGAWFALGFMGDDHVPRTVGWAQRYVDELENMGSGIVYGDDLFQGAKLPTQWAMTTDIVAALGRMVPAPVEHLYCDNAIAALGLELNRLQFMPDVVIEHMHPLAGKAETDDGYRWANSAMQYRRDEAAYKQWLATGLRDDVAVVRAAIDIDQ